jgi:hypothetical protein
MEIKIDFITGTDKITVKLQCMCSIELPNYCDMSEFNDKWTPETTITFTIPYNKRDDFIKFIKDNY